MSLANIVPLPPTKAQELRLSRTSFHPERQSAVSANDRNYF
jgi:hypothetical protein